MSVGVPLFQSSLEPSPSAAEGLLFLGRRLYEQPCPLSGYCHLCFCRSFVTPYSHRSWAIRPLSLLLLLSLFEHSNLEHLSDF